MSKRILCPASSTAGRNGTERLHYCSQGELDANRGICAECSRRFERQLKRMEAEERKQAGQHGDEPYQFAVGVAFVDGHPEPTVDFKISEDDELEEIGLDAAAVLAIAKFCRRMFEIGGTNSRRFYEAAHAFAFAAHIHPEMELSGEEIARIYFKNPKTKQAFFKQVNRYRDILKLPRTAGAKSNSARTGIYRKRMKESHAQRKRNRNNQQPDGSRAGLAGLLDLRDSRPGKAH